jgi:predicted acyltransferase
MDLLTEILARHFVKFVFGDNALDNQEEATVTSEETSAHSLIPSKGRLLSLDVFRGFTLLGMVLVNSHPGEAYPPLAHAGWNQWSFTDLIFPFFVFIVGVAIPYSFASRLERGASRQLLFWQILRRSVLLFAVGLFLNGFPRFDFSTLRVMGVLQRIAICYFLASIIFVYLRLKAKSIVWLSGTILVLYFILMKFVPVPGYGAGVLEPMGNWGNYIDQHLLAGRMQHDVWEGKSLLGSFPSLVTMLMGLLTGLYLRTAHPAYEKITHLYFYGSVCMAAGAFWSLWFPINQNLWSSSLVLFMGGMALLFLATFYYIVDLRKISWWTLPCLIYGMNSIAVWVFSQLGMKALMAINITGSDGVAINLWKAGGNSLVHYLGPMNGSLAFAILYDLFWLGVMGILYWRRIFIKL